MVYTHNRCSLSVKTVFADYMRLERCLGIKVFLTPTSLPLQAIRPCHNMHAGPLFNMFFYVVCETVDDHQFVCADGQRGDPCLEADYPVQRQRYGLTYADMIGRTLTFIVVSLRMQVFRERFTADAYLSCILRTRRTCRTLATLSVLGGQGASRQYHSAESDVDGH